MDFFESQELARRNTRWLVFLFVLAVLAIIASIYGIAVVAVMLTTKAEGAQLWAIVTDWRLIAGVVSAVLAVIGLGSATKMVELRHGGSAVASMMGGRRVVGNSKQLTDRRVANIVEEMALASGMPVPPVYILDNEPGINAFAAGYTVDDAVIGINRGTAEQLSREELQGVIAHEFSHILNGDMRMSLRMVAILNGILLISIIGGILIRSLSFSGGRFASSGSSDSKQQGGKVILLLIAFGLYAIGSIGLLFGRMIKSTISRQREYLADASAVQFTRMPDGIADALKMIGGSSDHSFIKSANAEQISHMFFGSARSNMMFATHPPLLKRIHKVDDRFDGDFQQFMSVRQKRRRPLQQEEADQAKQGTKKRPFDFLPGSERLEGFEKMNFPINPAILIAGIGIPTSEDVEYSGLLVGEIPADMLHAARETFSARCVVFASLLSDDPTVSKDQLAKIGSRESRGTVEMTLKAQEMHRRLPARLRLAVFEIIQGTLSAMSPAQYPEFCQTINDLIVADRKIDLFEFFLYHHLIVHLDRCFLAPQTKRNLYDSVEAVKAEVGHMLSVLSCVGQTDPKEQRSVFENALTSIMPTGTRSDNLFMPQWNPEELIAALKKLALATPAVKKKVLSAAVMAISHDNVLTVQEVELFRAMSESLDCPVPPLVATHEYPPSLPESNDIES